MTDLRLAATRALEALENVTHHFTRTPSTLKDSEVRGDAHKSITALRAAMAQPDVPEGWVLVPVEPTHEMCDQGAQAIVQWENGCVWPDSWGDTYAKQYRKDAKKAYSAMLAAAPKGGV